MNFQEDHGQLAQYTKLTERLKAERRSLKILRGAAIEERGQRTAVLLASSTLPRAVGASPKPTLYYCE